MEKIDLLTIGDASIDEFLKVHDAQISCDINHKDCKICFEYGKKIPVDKFQVSVAGNSVNVAIGAKNLGLKTSVYSEIGNDSNGKLVIKELKKHGVKTNLINQNEETNTNVHPIVVFKGERTIFSYHEDQEYKLKPWNKPKFLYYTSLSKGFESFQSELLDYLNKNEDIIFAMNPGSTQLKTNINAIKQTFKRLNVLFVNKGEAEKLTDIKGSIEDLHKKLNLMGIDLSVITDGDKGSSTFDGNKFEKIGIYDIGKKVDATGAGDSFASGFISAMFYGKDAKTAMGWGAMNAGHVITKVGAIKGLLNKTKIEKLIKKKSLS